MMELITAGVAVSLLVQYAQHVAGLAGRVVDDAIVDRLKAAWAAVAERFRPDSQAAGALRRLADRPEDSRRQATVEDHLEEVLAADPGFAALLTRLLTDLPKTAISGVDIRDSGAVAIGGSVNLSGGGPVAGRDVSVHRSSPGEGGTQ